MLTFFFSHRGKQETSLQEHYRQQTYTVLGQQSSTIETIRTGQTETLNAFLQQRDIARNVETISENNQSELLNQKTTLVGLGTQTGQLLDRANKQLAIAEETRALVQTLHR
jgi:hypothetical protein